MPQEYVVRVAGDLVTLRKRLENPEPLLRQMGAILASDAKASFDRQALGEIQWPERYPGQSPPFLNVAGAVADFTAGRAKPLPRRFDNRPAGIDTSDTRRRITFKVVGKDAIEVGSNSPQANRLQNGGTSTQPITPETKKRMAAFLKPKKTRASPLGEVTDEELAEAAKREGLRYKPKKERGSNPRTDVEFTIPSPYRDKLGPLFQLTELKTKVRARPFIGVTDTTRPILIRAAEDFFATGRM